MPGRVVVDSHAGRFRRTAARWRCPGVAENSAGFPVVDWARAGIARVQPGAELGSHSASAGAPGSRQRFQLVAQRRPRCGWRAQVVGVAHQQSPAAPAVPGGIDNSCGGQRAVEQRQQKSNIGPAAACSRQCPGPAGRPAEFNNAQMAANRQKRQPSSRVMVGLFAGNRRQFDRQLLRGRPAPRHCCSRPGGRAAPAGQNTDWWPAPIREYVDDSRSRALARQRQPTPRSGCGRRSGPPGRPPANAQRAPAFRPDAGRRATSKPYI